jgi:hypothetical protein
LITSKLTTVVDHSQMVQSALWILLLSSQLQCPYHLRFDAHREVLAEYTKPAVNMIYSRYCCASKLHEMVRKVCGKFVTSQKSSRSHNSSGGVITFLWCSTFRRFDHCLQLKPQLPALLQVFMFITSSQWYSTICILPSFTHLNLGDFTATWSKRFTTNRKDDEFGQNMAYRLPKVDTATALRWLEFRSKRSATLRLPFRVVEYLFTGNRNAPTITQILRPQTSNSTSFLILDTIVRHEQLWYTTVLNAPSIEVTGRLESHHSSADRLNPQLNL